MLARIGRAAACGGAVVVVSAASAQVFTLDDFPNTAEDPFLIGLPAALAGFVGPSPSLGFGYIPGDVLGPFVPGPPHVFPPNGLFVNAISSDKSAIDHRVAPRINLEFTVDRATTGMPGTPLFFEAGFDQQAGDIYRATTPVAHPGFFVGTLTPGILPPVPTFGGVLPTAGFGGGHFLLFDESAFGLTAMGAPGVLVPPGVPTIPTTPGVKDNMNAWNNTLLDVTGDMITDVNFFFSISPAEALAIGTSPAEIYDVAAGAPGTAPLPYAPAPALGLDLFGHATDDLDAVIVWDHGLKLGPFWGGPGAEALVDYALFSLAPGSATLFALAAAGLPVDGATVFFTDFTGSFGIYLFSFDMGIDPHVHPRFFPNIDGLDFVPAPGTLGLLALSGLCVLRRRR